MVTLIDKQIVKAELTNSKDAIIFRTIRRNYKRTQ